ncbi:MAG: hypothetical protein KAH56_08540 [Candidatus Krumholzibacteria bacterium]|nr:hypothetical protein [Candidatus Krumholzibacteria bacterium]
MVMGRKWKLGLGIGCGLMLLIVVGFLGVGTWYAGQINQEYKEVTDSEKALLAATEGDLGFTPPLGGIPGPERIEVFLAVREDLDSWRRTMATASSQFADDQERQRAGGLKDLVKLLNTGSDLMPIYAGFWTARNEALLAHEMGPGEYGYIYRLVYQTWLELERPDESATIFPSTALGEAFEPYRDRLVATFDAAVNPVELIFQKNGE